MLFRKKIIFVAVFVFIFTTNLKKKDRHAFNFWPYKPLLNFDFIYVVNTNTSSGKILTA